MNDQIQKSKKKGIKKLDLQLLRDIILRCPFEDSYLDFKNRRKLNLSERVKNFISKKSGFLNQIGLTKT